MKFSIRDFFSKCDQMRSFLCSDTHIPREHFFFFRTNLDIWKRFRKFSNPTLIASWIYQKINFSWFWTTFSIRPLPISYQVNQIRHSRFVIKVNMQINFVNQFGYCFFCWASKFSLELKNLLDFLKLTCSY